MSLIQPNGRYHLSIFCGLTFSLLYNLILISIISRTRPLTVLGRLHTNREQPDAACSSQPHVMKCANPDSRPEALWETHVPLPILSSNQWGNGSSLHEHAYNCECKKMCAHIHTDISVCLKDREGEKMSLLQQMATMPWAKSKSGQHTDNCCQSREESISSMYIKWMWGKTDGEKGRTDTLHPSHKEFCRRMQISIIDY